MTTKTSRAAQAATTASWLQRWGFVITAAGIIISIAVTLTTAISSSAAKSGMVDLLTAENQRLQKELRDTKAAAVDAIKERDAARKAAADALARVRDRKDCIEAYQRLDARRAALDKKLTGQALSKFRHEYGESDMSPEASEIGHLLEERNEVSALLKAQIERCPFN